MDAELRQCPACGSRLAPGATFCECGEKFEPSFTQLALSSDEFAPTSETQAFNTELGDPLDLMPVDQTSAMPVDQVVGGFPMAPVTGDFPETPIAGGFPVAPIDGDVTGGIPAGIPTADLQALQAMQILAAQGVETSPELLQSLAAQYAAAQAASDAAGGLAAPAAPIPGGFPLAPVNGDVTGGVGAQGHAANAFQGSHGGKGKDVLSHQPYQLLVVLVVTRT
jgi:hypothetical protein